MESKKALIAANLVGFLWFVMDDIDILRSMGYEVTVAADNSLNETWTEAEIIRRGASFIDIRCDSKSPLAKKNFDCYLRYRELMNREKFDAVVCHTPITGLIVRAAAMPLRRRGSKVIYMSHGLAWTHLSDRRTVMKFRTMESIGSRLCDAIVTINEEDRLEAMKLHSAGVYKIDGVGCDIERYRDICVDRSAVRRSIGVDEDRILLLAVGELSARKNHITVAKALALLPDKDRYVFVIAGRDLAGTGIGSDILEFAGNNGLDVRLLGFRDDIPSLVHAADIGIIPSVREGLGMAGIQQLCAGVPLVGTAVQGIREYISDGVTGFTVNNPYDTVGFANAISRLSDRKLRQSMARDCIRMAEKFGKKQSIEARKSIFREVFGSD